MSAPELPRRRWRSYDDGIVRGRLLQAGRTCDVCFRHTSCIEVARYDNMLKEWRSTVIWIHRGDQELAVYLGVGCGCLAKFHRQVAHVRDHEARRTEH